MSWTKADELDHVLVPTTTGEYLQPIFRNEGTLTIVSPTGSEEHPLRIHLLEIRIARWYVG